MLLIVDETRAKNTMNELAILNILWVTDFDTGHEINTRAIKLDNKGNIWRRHYKAIHGEGERLEYNNNLTH